MAKRRNFTDRFKAKMTLEALRGDKSLQETAAMRKKTDHVFTKSPSSDRGLHAQRRHDRQAVDGRDGIGGNLHAAQNQPAASSAPDLSVLAEKDANRPDQPCLVR